MVKQNCLSSQKNSFPSSNETNNEPGPEEKVHKSLFRMKHHHQDHLDPDHISFSVARFKKVYRKTSGRWEGEKAILS